MPAALRKLERRVAIDPGAEVAWQRLILIQSESGDTSGARRTWEACRRALAGVGRQPGGEILALVRRIPVAPSAGLAPASAVALGRSTTPATAAISGQPARFEPGLVPLLRRERELAQLQFTYEQARAGSTRLMLLEGEAGIGKSFLARKYLAWVQSQGADVVAGRALQTGRLPPYAAVVEALRERLEHENAPEDLVDDIWLAELAVLLPELRIRYPDLPEAARNERLPQVRLFEAVSRLCLALAQRRPLVLSIDDVQWADSDTRQVLGYAVRRWVEASAPCVVLLTVRSEDAGARPRLARWLGGLEREAPTIRLSLGPLATEAVVRWVGSLRGVGDAAPGGAGEAVAAFGDGWQNALAGSLST